MASVCSICGKKISGFITDYPLSPDHMDVRICGDCDEKMYQLKNGNDREATEAKAYFNQFISRGVSTVVVEEIGLIINKDRVEKSSDNAENTQQKEWSHNAETYTNKISSFFDELYANIGQKLKSWAKTIFVIEAVAAIVCGILMVFRAAFDSYEEEWFVPGLVTMIFGPVVALVSTWVLYAFGELVDKVCVKEKQDEKLLSDISRSLRAIEDSSDKMLEIMKNEKS